MGDGYLYSETKQCFLHYHLLFALLLFLELEFGAAGDGPDGAELLDTCRRSYNAFVVTVMQNNDTGLPGRAYSTAVPMIN